MSTETFGIALFNTDTNSQSGDGQIDFVLDPGGDVKGSMSATIDGRPFDTSLVGKWTDNDGEGQLVSLRGHRIELTLLQNAYFDNGSYAGSANWEGGRGVFNVSLCLDS